MNRLILPLLILAALAVPCAAQITYLPTNWNDTDVVGSEFDTLRAGVWEKVYIDFDMEEVAGLEFTGMSLVTCQGTGHTSTPQIRNEVFTVTEAVFFDGNGNQLDSVYHVTGSFEILVDSDAEENDCEVDLEFSWDQGASYYGTSRQPFSIDVL